MIEIVFESVSERNTVHQWIREGARNIDEENEVLESLFLLENGESRTGGFGWVEQNDPLSETVVFRVSEDDFNSIIGNIENASVDHLSTDMDRCEEQNEKIIRYLHSVAEKIKENRV